MSIDLNTTTVDLEIDIDYPMKSRSLVWDFQASVIASLVILIKYEESQSSTSSTHHNYFLSEGLSEE